MKLKEAKEYFALGVITGFRAEPAPMEQGWVLHIRGKDRAWHLHTALGKMKVYAKVDTLVAEVAEITGQVRGLAIEV